MAAKITLTIGKRKLEFTPEEAREIQKQLGDILGPIQPRETFHEAMRRNQELELERLRKENRERHRDYPRLGDPVIRWGDIQGAQGSRS